MQKNNNFQPVVIYTLLDERSPGVAEVSAPGATSTAAGSITGSATAFAAAGAAGTADASSAGAAPSTGGALVIGALLSTAVSAISAFRLAASLAASESTADSSGAATGTRLASTAGSGADAVSTTRSFSTVSGRHELWGYKSGGCVGQWRCIFLSCYCYYTLFYFHVLLVRGEGRTCPVFTQVYICASEVLLEHRALSAALRLRKYCSSPPFLDKERKKKKRKPCRSYKIIRWRRFHTGTVWYVASTVPAFVTASGIERIRHFYALVTLITKLFYITIR